MYCINQTTVFSLRRPGETTQPQNLVVTLENFDAREDLVLGWGDNRVDLVVYARFNGVACGAEDSSLQQQEQHRHFTPSPSLLLPPVIDWPPPQRGFNGSFGVAPGTPPCRRVLVYAEEAVGSKLQLSPAFAPLTWTPAAAGAFHPQQGAKRDSADGGRGFSLEAFVTSCIDPSDPISNLESGHPLFEDISPSSFPM